jgi:hypothetical protein
LVEAAELFLIPTNSEPFSPLAALDYTVHSPVTLSPAVVP